MREKECLEALSWSSQNLVRNFPSWVQDDMSDLPNFAERIASGRSLFIDYEDRMASCHENALVMAHMSRISKMSDEERASRLEEVRNIVTRIRHSWNNRLDVTGDENVNFYRVLQNMASNPYSKSSFIEYELLVKWDGICKTEEKKADFNNRLKGVKSVEDVLKLYDEIIDAGFDLYTMKKKSHINNFFEGSDADYLEYIDDQSNNVHRCRFENLYKCVIVK